MTKREHHLASTVPVAFLAVALGYHPLVAVPLIVGVLLPEIDAHSQATHRSWLLHTFLAPALVYWALVRTGLASDAAVVAVHFVTVGMGLHFLADYVYPRKMSHRGAEWPVRPVGISAPWGLIWLGAAWALQWFAYLAPAFLPWVAGL